MEMDFDDFEKVENTDYPGSIEMNFVSPGNTVSIKTKNEWIFNRKNKLF